MRMSTVEIDGQGATVRLQGALTLAEAQTLRPELQKAVAGGVTGVVFDLDGSAVVDSSGIGLLIATHNSLKPKGGTLRVTNVSAEILNLFKAMRLDRHFTVEGRQA
jgi:anti-anti-sigma factor